MDDGESWREKHWEFSKGDPAKSAPWGLTDENELFRLFWFSWDRLSPRQREALMLRKREDLSFRQIGKKLGISGPAAFKLCQKALKGLTVSP